MPETGKVREVRENLVIVAPERGAACFGCMNATGINADGIHADGIHAGCKSSACFITAENPAGLPLKTGQTVEVVPRRASLLGQALIALLPPVFGFMLGFNLSRLVFPFPTAPDGASAGMGLLFLFAAAFVVYLVRKKHPASRGYEVTRIITNC